MGEEMAEIISPDPANGIPPAQLAQQAQQQSQQLHAYAVSLEQKIQEMQAKENGHIIDNQYKTDREIAIEKMKIEAQITMAEINTKAQSQSERAQWEADIWKQFHEQAHDIAMQHVQAAHAQDLAAQQSQAAMAQQQQAQEAQPEPAAQGKVMSETLTAPAESSPAPQAAPVMPKPGTSEYAQWRMTGDIPEPKADPAPAKETPAKAKAEEKPAPASEPGDKQERRQKTSADTERRINEIMADLKAAGFTPAELKSFRRHEYQRINAEPGKPAPEQTVKPAVDPKAPVMPKPGDFEGKPWAEYEAARDKAIEELIDYKAERKVEAERQRIKTEAEAKDMRDRLDATAERYGADARGVIEKTAKIFDDSSVNVVVKALLNDSPILTDLLYVIGGDGEKYAEFIEDARRNPAKAIRELVLLEDLTKQELKGAKAEMPEKGPDGKFVAKTPEPKRTAAPPPPKEVSGRGSQPPDELERAVKDNDFRAFKAIEDREALRKRKGS